MYKSLVIARCYLFKHSTGGQVERSFFENLPKETFDVTVVCSNRDKLTESPGVRTFMINEKKYYRYFAAVLRRIFIPDIMNLPDYVWFSWGRKTTRKVLKKIETEDYDYIHSISFPCSSHQVALKVKNKTNIPWIAQFYDPWYDNPYRIFKTKYFKKIDLRMERSIVENADIIIHNNTNILDIWKKRYGHDIGEKMLLLPLTFRLPVINEFSIERRDGFLTLSHIGNFTLERNSIVFIKALDVFLKEHLEFKNRIKVNYIGKVTREERELIVQLGLERLFNIVGTIPEEDCGVYYMETDIFLAIDGENGGNPFFPSKILKYFYFQKPILGITPEGSVLDKELNNAGHVSLRNSDINGIVFFLFRAMTDNNSIQKFKADYWNNFTTENVSVKYKKVVAQMLKKIQ